MRKSTPGALVLAGFAVLGCTGAIGESGPPSGDPSGNGPANPTGGASIPSPDTGLWRLTRAEINNTLRDLLGDSTHAANLLTDDPLQGGFDNNAEVLVGHDLDSDKLDRIAASVVEAAFGPGSTRARLLGAARCSSNTISQGCARALVSAFARRAWRRPVDAAEIDRLMMALGVASGLGDSVEEGVKTAFRMALMSPHFLFRVELDPSNVPGLHPLTPYELATRMSYFVWSTTPDDPLLATADATGTANLSNPDVFATQLARLLADPRAADPKAQALVGNFAAQWLDTRKLADAGTVAPKYRFFDEDLRRAMIAESMSFFGSFLNGDRNLTDMLDADFTFVNARLAKHYGLSAVGTDMNMKQLTVGGDTHRGGLLTMAGILTVTSKPDRTSPTDRGKWVLARLLCAPPPLPPNKVPSLEESAKSLPANATIRDKMEAHRKDPACAGCHLITDPIGFGLENYDSVGLWRTSYAGNVGINAQGELPGSGAKFDGAEQLSQQIKKDPRFLQCFVKSMFSYAMGRRPQADGDVALIANLTTDTVAHGGRVRDLIGLIASSQAFQSRGGHP